MGKRTETKWEETVGAISRRLDRVEWNVFEDSGIRIESQRHPLNTTDIFPSSVEKYTARWRWWSILVLSLSFSPYYFLFFLYVAINPRRFRDGADLAISTLSLSFSGYIFLSLLARRESDERYGNVDRTFLFQNYDASRSFCNAKKYRYCRISVVVIFISYLSLLRECFNGWRYLKRTKV